MILARLKEWRESRGIKQTELASAANVTPFTVVRAEGGGSLRVTSAKKLADALAVTVADLQGEPPVPAPRKVEGPPAWAATGDMNTFSERVTRLPLGDLKGLAVELAIGEPILTREDLPLSREKRGTRVANFARAMVVADEFLGRGVAPPPQFAVAYRRHLEALTSPTMPEVQAKRPAPEIPEAG